MIENVPPHTTEPVFLVVEFKLENRIVLTAGITCSLAAMRKHIRHLLRYAVLFCNVEY